MQVYGARMNTEVLTRRTWRGLAVSLLRLIQSSAT